MMWCALANEASRLSTSTTQKFLLTMPTKIAADFFRLAAPVNCQQFVHNQNNMVFENEIIANKSIADCNNVCFCCRKPQFLHNTQTLLIISGTLGPVRSDLFGSCGKRVFDASKTQTHFFLAVFKMSSANRWEQHRSPLISNLRENKLFFQTGGHAPVLLPGQNVPLLYHYQL